MSAELPPLTPSSLPASSVEIESTTYHEGAVGDFLADFLAQRGWAVEKTPVEQPPESANGGPRWNVYAGIAGPDARPGLFHAHGHRSALHPLQRGRGVPLRPRRLRRQRNSRRPGGRRRGLACRGISGRLVVCLRRRARLRRRQGRQPRTQGQPLPHQRRTHRQPPRPGLQRRSARRLQVYRQDGPLGLSRAGRERHPQARRGARQAARPCPCPSLEGIGPSTLNIGQIQGGHAPNVIADKAEAQVLVRTVTDSAPVRAAAD